MSVRVMVVDDSVVVRRSVSDALDVHPEIDVVATAVDGDVALRKIAELEPDVVILDIEMPVRDGLETLVEIRARWPRIAVIMFSTLTERNATVSLEALSLGAVDYATKPTRLTDRQAAHDHVVEHVQPLVLLWGTRAVPRRSQRDAPTQSFRTSGYGARAAAADVTPEAATFTLAHRGTTDVDLIVLGTSTGGPDALARLLPRLPADLPVPVVIVQHMPPVFTAMLAKRLDAACALTVTESVDGEPLRAGHAYLAAGGTHLEVQRGLRLAHTDAPHENSCRPAVDVLFRAAAAATDGRLLAVVLTGMGRDGLLGSHAVVDAGGTVIAQNEASSVVWGMPGFVARAGIASAVLPLDDIAEPLSRVRLGPSLAGATS